MAKLKSVLIVLVIYLSIIFNLERIEYRAGIEGFGVHSFVYLLVLVSLVILFLQAKIVTFPRIAYLAFWTTVYIVLRLTFFNDGQIVGGIATYVTITELTILLLANVIGFEVVRCYHAVEQYIEEIFLPATEKRIHPLSTVKEFIITEFIRSRRYQHPLSLVVIQPDIKSSLAEMQSSGTDIQKQIAGRFISARVSKLLSREVRRIDMIINPGDDDHSFLILCPETKGEAAGRVAERIRNNIENKLGVSVTYGVASFPEDALTFEDLSQKAKNRLNEAEASLIRLPTSPTIEPMQETQ
jgi:GGDEF domain-containing protein